MSQSEHRDRVRAWWWHRQGLDGSLAGSSATRVLERSGWARSVGGCSPYLALFARAGITREEVDKAAAALQLQELPAARGCTYVVPQKDYALALLAGQKNDELAMAKKYCAVNQKEIDRLCEAVLQAVEASPLDPQELKDKLGAEVRNLGPEGKRKGLTTTLPLALGLLLGEGRIRRLPVGGRLDEQRYRYTSWSPSPLERVKLTKEKVAVEMARRFFQWAAPASLARFAWWAGLSKQAASKAVAALRLVPLNSQDDRLLSADDRDSMIAWSVPKEPHYSLIGSVDSFLHHRRDISSLLDEDNIFLPTNEGVAEIAHHVILDRGHLIGLWDYDTAQERIVSTTFGRIYPGLWREIERVETFVREQLGDARAFSLDSPKSRVTRLESLVRLGS